jgi:hypothetical protein
LCNDNQLGNHGVVIWWNGISSIYVCVNSDSMSTRTMVISNFPRTRSKVLLWIFCIDTALNRMHLWIVIFTRNFMSSCD